MNNSLTGTPMYMSPEIIKNEKKGRHGAMDIWALGCVVLEFATGKKPWSNLDNEWCDLFVLKYICRLIGYLRAIMFHIGVATQHPPLPEPGQLSHLGISFIKQCLIIDPVQRPSATELMEHPWMVQFRETFLNDDPETTSNLATETLHDTHVTVAPVDEIMAKGVSEPTITPPTDAHSEAEEVYEYSL